jgi:hypothetical protein
MWPRIREKPGIVNRGRRAGEELPGPGDGTGGVMQGGQSILTESDDAVPGSKVWVFSQKVKLLLGYHYYGSPKF